MLRQLLKSKIHRAVITRADPEYEGSIEIPEDLMKESDLWPGEKVLVASIDTGARLETYVQKGPSGTGSIIMNGGAARCIKAGELVTIMAFGEAETPISPRIILCNKRNEIVRRSS